jgi:predicted kinase
MELILLIGLQASGKSTFRRTYFSQTHVCISKDDFPKAKNRNRRQKRLLEEAFQQNHSVIIDNTNPVKAERAELILIAKAYQAEVVGYYFESIVADSLKRNAQREGLARVPDVALYSTIKRLERPVYAEGFDKLFYVRITEENRFEMSDWIQDDE